MKTHEAEIRAMPLWHGEPRIRSLHGGLSNVSYVVEDDADASVVRFGRDFPFHHVSRDREAMVARAAHAGGFAPEVRFYESGVMVSRFLTAETYTEETVRRNAVDLARFMRGFHQGMGRHVSGPATCFWVFHVIRDYARQLTGAGHRYAGRCADWLDLSDRLESLQVPLPIVFGHHDLLAANFLHDGTRLWLIDFEYAAYGTAMFDLAGLSSNSGLSAEQSHDMLAAYFDAPPDRNLMRSHAAMAIASLLREGMWSMVSEIHLDVPGVDYVAYSDEQLDRLDAALSAYRAEYGDP